MSTVRVNGRHYRAYPAGAYLGYENVSLDLATDETAFLIVDVNRQRPQAGQAEPAELEYMSAAEWDVVANRIRPAKDAAKAVGIPCVYTTNSAPRIELKRSAFGIQRKQNLGQGLDELLAEPMTDPREYIHGDSPYVGHADVITPEPDDYYVRKHVYSGFWETRLDSLLRNLGVRNLVCSGFHLDICLFTTMIDALYRNYKIVLIRDATQAVEIPEVDGTGLSFTERMVLWTECHLGHTTTSEEWITACQETSDR